MKYIPTLIIGFITFVSIGQEKVQYNGLNLKVPQEFYFGMRAHANYYFPSYNSEYDETFFSSVSSDDLPGVGAGFYFRYKLNERMGLQPEINIHHRQGNVINFNQFVLDTAITISKEELFGFSTIWFEIPVNFRYSWAFTPLSTGHWKPKSALSVYAGPRLVLMPFRRGIVSRSTSTYSELYGQTSLSVRNNIIPSTKRGAKFSPLMGVGIAIGVDYELWNGFNINLSYYRGLTSHSSKSNNGFRAIDNRLEVGIGFRFN